MKVNETFGILRIPSCFVLFRLLSESYVLHNWASVRIGSAYGVHPT